MEGAGVRPGKVVGIDLQSFELQAVELGPHLRPWVDAEGQAAKEGLPAERGKVLALTQVVSRPPPPPGPPSAPCHPQIW